jgi:hypothetical protein
VQQIDRSRDVRVNDAAYHLEILVEERVTEAAARVREERLDRAAPGCRAEFVYAGARRKVRLDGFDGRPRSPQQLRRVLNRRLVGRDEQVEAIPGAAACELEADAG